MTIIELTHEQIAILAGLVNRELASFAIQAARIDLAELSELLNDRGT